MKRLFFSPWDYGRVEKRRQRLREDDGIHPTQGGGWLVTQKVLEVVAD